MKNVTIKQMIGVLFILCVLSTTMLAVAGIWGIVSEANAYKMFWTLVSAAIGLGVSGSMLDTFFKDDVVDDETEDEIDEEQ